MSKTIINQDEDIDKNRDYKDLLDKIARIKIDFKQLVECIFETGSKWEDSYNIWHHKECYNKRKQYINKMTKLYTAQQQKLIDIIIQLKKENIILKRALKEIGKIK
jgi:acetyl-CoA carboxylase carboxyltransferase component